MNDHLAIQMQDVSYEPILHNISISIAPSEKVAIIGQSGAGKTTLLRLLTGAYSPTSGSVTEVTRGRFTYIPQDLDASLNPALSVATIVTEPVAIAHGRAAARKAKARAQELLAQLGLGAEFLTRKPAHLSGGQRQRVGIARALITDPDIIFADESLSALDADTREIVTTMFGDNDATLILITHDLAAATLLCDRWVLLDNGTIAEEGTIQSLWDTTPPVSPARQAFLDADRILHPTLWHEDHRIGYSASERLAADVLSGEDEV